MKDERGREGVNFVTLQSNNQNLNHCFHQQCLRDLRLGFPNICAKSKPKAF